MRILGTSPFYLQKDKYPPTLTQVKFRKGELYRPAHLDRATTGAFGHILAKRTYFIPYAYETVQTLGGATFATRGRALPLCSEAAPRAVYILSV